MKRDALNHPKMLDLASRLDICRAHAVGIINLLFDFTAQYAAQGDIGKHRDGAIARACDWMSDPSAFVEALVLSGWIDKNAVARLLVHDWPEHCEQWVKLKLQKLKLDFHPGYSAEAIAEPIAEAVAIDSAELSASRDQAKPSQAPTKPSQAKQIHVPDGGVLNREILDAWNVAMDQNCELTAKRLKSLAVRVKDEKWLASWREAITKAAVSDFCRGLGDKGWIADFEWFLKPDSVTKLIEGKYDNRNRKAISAGVTHKETVVDANHGVM